MDRSVIKWFLYYIALIILFSFQTSAGMRIEFFGAHMDMLPFLVAAVAVNESPRGASLFAFIAGMLCDINMTREITFYCGVYFILALVISVVNDMYLRKSYLSSLMWGTGVFIVKSLCRSIVLSVSVKGATFVEVLSYEGASFVISLIASVVVYLFVYLIGRITPVETITLMRVGKNQKGRIIPSRPKRYRTLKMGDVSRREEHFWNNLFK